MVPIRRTDFYRRLTAYLRAYSRRKHVRPWSLLAPVVVLLICLPLLQPLRDPLNANASDDTLARLATVQALVEQQSFGINATGFWRTKQKIHIGDTAYSDQPPTHGLLLAGPYWVMHRFGLTFATNPTLVQYLLTLVGVTIPVAAAAGMLYRMGRLFELRRPWRAGLAVAVVLGSGFISYATVLNPYAPAASLVLGAVAVLVQVSLVRSPIRSGGYLISAGFFAALAAAIDPAAIVFTVLLAGVICVMRWRPSTRLAGVLLYGIGVVPPLLLHLSLSFPITGDWRLGLSSLSPRPPSSLVVPTLPARFTDPADDALFVGPPTFWQQAGTYLGRLCGAFFGVHGLLVHFPVLVFGIAGVASVMHRHWPMTTKVLAVSTAAAAVVVTLRYVSLPLDWKWAMFAVRWYVVFLPLLLFWAGAWLRRSHHPATWSVAAVFLGFSVAVSIIGATNPTPRAGYNHYTVISALKSNLIHSDVVDDEPAVANR